MRGTWIALIGAALALAGTGLASAADWSRSQPVAVVTVEYRFQPNRLDFRQGVAYRLHLENRGRELHEFTAPNFFRAVELGNPEVLNPERSEIVLHPGEQKDLYFVPLHPGRYRLTCSDHDWAGMTGEITVE